MAAVQYVGGSKVGVVGLGRMGMPIGARLVRSGYKVVGYDTRREARAEGESFGIEIVDSPRELGASTHASIVIVGFDDEVNEACLGQDTGLLLGASEAHIIIVCSTVRPETVIQLGHSASKLGVDVLDATLSRAEKAAIDGTLLAMVGGERAVFERCEPMLSAFASDIFHLGALGSGQIAKMINNQLLWSAVVANWEALRLGRRLGVDQEVLRQAILNGSGSNWALGTWNASRPMPWAEDDMAMVLEHAERVGLEVPLASVVSERIARIKEDRSAWRSEDAAVSAMSDYLEAVEAEIPTASDPGRGDSRLES